MAPLPPCFQSRRPLWLAPVLTLTVFHLHADPADALKTLRAVGPEGQGNAAASKAWKEVAASPVSELPRILGAMDGANPLALNWLRTAVDTVTDRAHQAGQSLPVADLGDFLLDQGHHPKARDLAFGLLQDADPDGAQRLVPGLLNDPSTDLRRIAVQQLIDQGAPLVKKDPASAALVFRQALQFSRDVDQIQSIAKNLRDLKRDVDLPRHFGFLMHWQVIGPFGNKDRGGFAQTFPPEQGVNLKAQHPGIEGLVGWREFITTDEYGMVDINQAFGPKKEVTAYAYTEFVSDNARPVELRLGCKNAWKVWVNGEFVFGRDEYHRGMRIDQYRMPVAFREGKNSILVKICQNEQTESWTKEWEFQLRVCDATGTALLSEDRPPTPLPADSQKETASR